MVYERQKTGVPVEVMLFDKPIKIIEKYKGQAKMNRLLPMMCNQKMNDYLKEIALICKIKKDITFHLARHTFATTVTLSNGMSLEAVQELLGHTSIKTTQIYARVVKTRIKEEMMMVAKKINQWPNSGNQEDI